MIDPVLLDAAAQVPGFWFREKTPHDIPLPYHVGRIDYFGPPPPAGTQLQCRAQIREESNGVFAFDLDLDQPSGRLWSKVTNWRNRIFTVPAGVVTLTLAPHRSNVSTPWAPEGVPSSVRLRRVSSWEIPPEFFSQAGGFWREVLANAILSRKERAIWKESNWSNERRREWLCGRLAAKELIREYARERWGLTLSPADIVIDADDHGRPVAAGSWVGQIGDVPTLSISHSAGLTVAALSGVQSRVGVDIERSDRHLPTDFRVTMFNASERDILHSVSATGMSGLELRFWCAKEAAAKCLGQGIANGLLATSVESSDSAGRKITVQTKGGERVHCLSTTDGEWVLAVATKDWGEIK